MPDLSPTFLCGACNTLMCDDCKSVAGEYEHLYQRQKLELMRAHEQLKELQQALAIAESKATSWQHVAKLGLPALMLAWMDAVGADEVIKAIKD